MSEALVVGHLSFEVRRSARRTTIGITIERDGALILTAPLNCAPELLERAARNKQTWIHNKLAEKELLFHRAPPKEFVNGEGFYYLGRSYRLLLVDTPKADMAYPPLQLHHGRFVLRRDEQAHGQDHFVNWYIAHGRPWIQHRVILFADRIGVIPSSLDVQDLGFRWGSCSHNQGIHFHWRTMLLPPSIVEYIVVHESVHLREPRHNIDFWKRMERAMPDFATRRQWIAENGWRF